MPAPEGPVEPPAVPLGVKMGKILPLHSPALSGGGISENILRDMMQGAFVFITRWNEKGGDLLTRSLVAWVQRCKELRDSQEVVGQEGE